MLTKFIPVARSINAVARQQAVRCMSGATPAHWKTDSEVALEQKSHMNNLPVPEGSWAEHHGARNSKWSMQLAGSIVLFIVTAFAMNQTNCFYLHDCPPMVNKK